jgi:para-aminobenzoate synthetase component II
VECVRASAALLRLHASWLNQKNFVSHRSYAVRLLLCFELGLFGVFCLVVLVIDNYDSFTYNLVQYLGEMKVAMEIRRNDQVSLEQIRALNPERILVSPGPCSPRESGLSNDIIRGFGTKVPLLGVCLGHQCIGYTFGGEVIVNDRIMHGKTSPIRHNGKDLFRDMPNPFAATRYHSLVIRRATLPDCLEVTAETEEGEIMGVRHKEYPIWGVQFHPESILTENGRQILKNFMTLQA